MDTVSAKEGDTADMIAFRERGATAVVTEALLKLNPGLAALGPLIPAGTPVVLPDPPAKRTIANVPRIWS